MSERAKKLLLIFSLCLNVGFILIAGMNYIQHQGIKRGGPHRLSAEAMFEGIELKAAQKQELEKLILDFKDQSRSSSRIINLKKIELYNLMGELSNIDDPEIDQVLSKLKQLKRKRSDMLYDHLKNVHRKLNSDQARKVFERFSERQEKWRR